MANSKAFLRHEKLCLNHRSENSSMNGVTEDGDDNTENSLTGHRLSERDENRQYFDAALRDAVRKQFRHFDDEPPIY